MTNQEYMEEALKEARISLEKNEVPVGAVVVYNGEIIGRGHNCRESNQMVTGHAEMMAIQQACETLKSWRLDDCSIYVTMEPCPMCAGTIIQSRIKNVFFGLEDKKAGAFGGVFDLSMIQGLNHYPYIYRGILENEAKDLLNTFFKNLRDKLPK